MLRKSVDSLGVVLENTAKAVDKAAEAGKFMAAVWMVKDDRIELVDWGTWNFPSGDFEAALTHLKNELEKEKKLLEKEKKPEPLPLGTPFLDRLRGNSDGLAEKGDKAFDDMVERPSLLEEVGSEKVPNEFDGPIVQVPSSESPVMEKVVGIKGPIDVKEEPDEKVPEDADGVVGGEVGREEGVEGREDGPPVQA